MPLGVAVPLPAFVAPLVVVEGALVAGEAVADLLGPSLAMDDTIFFSTFVAQTQSKGRLERIEGEVEKGFPRKTSRTENVDLFFLLKTRRERKRYKCAS